MNDIELIQNKIYEIRGQRVMLDRDLAELYGVETKRLNEQVKRNIERFPIDFMFQLTEKEMEDWKSQFATSNSIKMSLRKRPLAFTESGVAMLSSVLHSPLAIQVNIGIMRAFVTLRGMSVRPLPDNNEDLRAEIQALRDEMYDILHDQNEINEDTRAQLDAISTALAELQAKNPDKKPKRRIGFISDEK